MPDHVQTGQVFTAADLPDVEWGMYRKRCLTRAVRMDGPFAVQTREGLMTCADGWLALDSGSQPYPIAHDEFAAIYQHVPEGGS